MTKEKKMNALIFHGPNDLRLEKIPIPKIGPGEVLIKVSRALTCGTDFKAFRQGHPVLLNHQLPSPFGHEVAGTISEIGKNVKGWNLGERVVPANSSPCDQCFYCEIERPNLCENRFLLNGAYAEYLLIPKQIVKHNLHRIPDALDSQSAAMTEPLACVVRAFDQMDLQKNQTLGILGCGFMGLLFTQLAKAMGLKVIAIGRSHEKLEKAKTLGADEVLSILDYKDPIKNVLRLTPKHRGLDAIVEAAGLPQTWEQALQLVRPGGTVCFYGGCKKGSRFSLDTHQIHYQELKILGVFHHTPKHFAKSLNYLTIGLVKPEFFISKEIKLNDLPKHFQENQNKPFSKVAVLS